MKVTTVYIIVIIFTCVLLYQYHLYNVWVVDLVQRVDVDHNSKNYDSKSSVPSGELTPHLKKILHLIKSEQNVVASNVDVDIVQELIAESYKLLKIKKPAEVITDQPLDPPTGSSAALPRLYIITPTYRRAEQLAELTRMSHTLMLVPNIHWLVIEDAQSPTALVTDLLRRTQLPFDHLIAPMPKMFKAKKSKPRGVSNRNRGIDWIRANATSGVFYFADDDNTYDLEIFNQMRHTKRVSMWPVGLITKYGVSSPIVKNGSFNGFYDGWVASRKFPVDMAGFAVNVNFLHQRPDAKMPYRAGFEEDGFLKSLAPFEPKEIELLADNCTKIYTWHTQTKKNDASMALDIKKYNGTNIVQLKKILV